MARSSWRSVLLLNFFLNTMTVFGVLLPASVTVKHLDLRANPEPTARAVLPDQSPNLVDRSYYNTLCGFLTGNINYPVTCGNGYICATASAYRAAGCCNPNDLAVCTIPSTCIPYGGVCNAACQASNIAYTSCGYLSPYCITKVYEYAAPYYEYDCATYTGVFTILTSATGLISYSTTAPASSVASVAVVTHTIATTATATALADSSGGSSITNINCNSGSSCGNGNNNNGNGNGAGNKSGASIRRAASTFRLLSLLCTLFFTFL